MAARDVVKALAEAFRNAALDCHATGMKHAERAARLDVLASQVSEEQCQVLVGRFLTEGLVEIDDQVGEYRFMITSDGGDA